MYVDTEVFDHHIRFLKEHFEVLSFHELLTRWRTGDWDNDRRYCVITFDDGWLDNFLNAYSILRKHQVPATIFLPTDFIGTDQWFWPEKVSALIRGLLREADHAHRLRNASLVLKRFLNVDERRVHLASRTETAGQAFADETIERIKHLSPESIGQFINALESEMEFSIPKDRVLMNWDEVAQMSSHGISFGSHSCSHRILTKLPTEEVKTELVNSQRVLQGRTGNYLPVFCYPNGNTNTAIQRLVQECGYQAATGVRSGVEGKCPDNQFELRRISIHNDMTATVPLYAMRLFASVA